MTHRRYAALARDAAAVVALAALRPATPATQADDGRRRAPPSPSRRRRSRPAPRWPSSPRPGTITRRHQVRPARCSASRTRPATPEGFDVEIAKIIAAQARHRRRTRSSAIETVVGQPRGRSSQNGQVDIVVATYTINDKRKRGRRFAGPYYVAGPGHHGRKADNDDDHRAWTTSAGKKVCSVSGSTPAKNIADNYADQAQLDAVRRLLQVRRRAAQRPGRRRHHRQRRSCRPRRRQPRARFKLVGKPFTEEPYGIGLKKGDTDVPRRSSTTRSRSPSRTAPGPRPGTRTAGTISGTRRPSRRPSTATDRC